MTTAIEWILDTIPDEIRYARPWEDRRVGHPERAPEREVAPVSTQPTLFEMETSNDNR